MIEVQDVYFAYPNGVEALKGVSLKIEKGEFVAVMGQNGAGKTTLVKHFNGLLKPTKGTVLIEGTDTRKASIATLARKVGFVFQSPDRQLFCETVEEEIAFALKNFGYSEVDIQKSVEWALGTLDLTQYRKVSPFMLSGGERKRVSLASVLAWNPDIIVLDEPTIGQDKMQKERLRQFIVQLNSQDKTVVIVTHDIEFVADIKPRIVLMAQGKIIADGEAEKILTDPELVEQSSLVMPEVTHIFRSLKDLGFKQDIIDVNEAAKAILERLGEER